MYLTRETGPESAIFSYFYPGIRNRSMEKKKIAFIIIRYGVAVNGGAEAHCRMLAERLIPFYDVEVLTTTTRIPSDKA